jgi:hypothetical protein
MPNTERPDPEARLRAEVERAVAPYEGRLPPFMIAKLRELAERYWREHPQASRVLYLLDQKDRIRSGEEPTGKAEPGDEAAGARKKA